MYSFPSISANWFPAPTALLCSWDPVFARPREDVCASSYDGSAGCIQPLDGTAIKLHQTELSKNGSQSHRLRPGRWYDMDQSGFLPYQVNILLFSITQYSIKLIILLLSLSGMCLNSTHILKVRAVTTLASQCHTIHNIIQCTLAIYNLLQINLTYTWNITKSCEVFSLRKK